VDEVIQMNLTRDFRQTVVERAQRDPAFAKALLDEVATLFEDREETGMLPALHKAVAKIEHGESSPAAEVLARLRELRVRKS
jgi:hypothetical protein